MVFVPVPNTALVEVVATLNSQTVENTLWFEGSGAWTGTSLATLCAEVSSWWVAEIIPYLSSQYIMTVVRASDQASQTGPTANDASDAGTAGSITTGEALPNNVTCTVSFRTELRGRAYRGRNYMAGFRSSMLSATNTLSSTIAVNWIGGYTALSGAVTVNDATHVVVSRYPKTGPRVTGITTPVSVYLVDQTLDSQRRRLPGRGN